MVDRPDEPLDDFEAFASRWLADVVSVFLRAVRDPALAYDLAPPAHVLRELRCSDLVDAEPLHDRERERDGR